MVDEGTGGEEVSAQPVRGSAAGLRASRSQLPAALQVPTRVPCTCLTGQRTGGGGLRVGGRRYAVQSPLPQARAARTSVCQCV